MTRTSATPLRSRASWAAMAIAAPLAAASLAGSVAWARDHDPRATSIAESSAAVDGPAVGGEESASAADLEQRIAQIQQRAEEVRRQARGMESSAAAVPEPAPAPEPAPQPDTWTGASGG